jgi:hypothetical protein
MGWNAGARSTCDVAPSAPRRRPALGPHRPPSVRHHGVDHTSVNVAGPMASRPHPCAAVDRAAPCARRRGGHALRPTRWGTADQATWRACAPLDPPDAARTPPASHLLGRSSELPLRARRRRRPEIAGAPLCPPPLLKLKRSSGLYPHPLDPPVHVLWPAEPPARRHCGRRCRPPAPSPPTVAGAASCRTNPTKWPRVSSNPTLAAHSPESGRLSPPASLAPPPGTRLQSKILIGGACCKMTSAHLGPKVRVL